MSRSSTNPAYAELQTTTNFSFLRGGSHGEELVATAKALGLAGLAITDRNTLAGVVRAHAAAKEAGLALVVGARLDLTATGLGGTDGTDGLSPSSGPASLPPPSLQPPSLLCLPTDRAAYGRLCQLLTLGQRRAAKGQCLITLADVVAHAQGQILIALPPPDWNWRKQRDSERRDGEPGDGQAAIASFAGQLADLRRRLGPRARLYLAASHAYHGDDRNRIAALAHLAEVCRTPLVATGDVLYHTPDRRPLQDVLTGIREKCTLDQAGFQLEANAERHLKSPVEMARLFRGHEAALARTVEILDACRFSLDDLVYEYPDEPVPPGTTAQAHLEALTWAGATERYPAAQFPAGIPEKVRDALTREFAIIAKLAYAPYFLTVHDIVAYARAQGILCQGRGSAANSAVCYCLGITNVNPVEIDLLFDRFITPERKEPPDIDVDFEHERREEVIQYIYRRYGRERAGLAATVISYRARSAVREVGKVMGLSADTVAALAGMVWGSHPTSSGKAGGVLPEAHVREAGLDPADPRLACVLALTHELIGFPRHLSQHVGGFVLTRGPLSEIVPIGNAAMADRTCIEWDKDDLDTAGLLKVDILGLGMLTCIRRAFDLLALHHGRRLSLATVPREDKATYDMLCRADSIGVFQVESRAQMNMLPRLKPRCFYDLVIEVAIVRPGPIQGDMVHPYLRRRDGLEPEEYPAPDPRFGPPDELRQILGKTRGVPLFQEQAMRIAMTAAEFTADEVNQLRKAMATFRRRGTIGLLEDKMVSAMVRRGYERGFAERCFNQIKGFGDYGFPESHAASFAHLVYVSAWLKCHYPDVFAAALLNSQPMGFYAPAQIVGCARAHGVEVRPADVNCSDWDCTLEAFALRAMREASPLALSDQGLAPGPVFKNGFQGTSPLAGFQGAEPLGCRPLALRLGLRQIDGLRRDEAERLVAARTRPFRTVQDLWARAGVPLATLERLAAADAFRSLGLDRRQALWEVKALGAAKPLPLFGWRSEDLRTEVARHSLRERGQPRTPLESTAPQTPQFFGNQKTGGFGHGCLPRRPSGCGRQPVAPANLADTTASAGDLGFTEGYPALPTPDLPTPGSPSPEFGPEPAVVLPPMSLSEHVVSDYQTTRLSLKAHPLSFLRAALAAEGTRTCAGLQDAADGARVAVAGIVLVRQRPGSAKGVVFMTIEDETGIANAVIWAKTLERFRRVVMGARLVHITGRIQRQPVSPVGMPPAGDSPDTPGGLWAPQASASGPVPTPAIIHIVAQTLEDRSGWLTRLSEEDGASMPIPIANADEVRRPEPGSARGAGHRMETARNRLAAAPTSEPNATQRHQRGHPRDVRILPKSRDFH